MRKIVNSTYITLDGVIADPQLWSLEYFDADAAEFAIEQLRRSDALLMGRKTYEGFATAWPGRSGDEFSDTMNKIAKHVVSTTLTTPSWNNSSVLDRDLVAAVRELKSQPGKDILMYGYGPVAQTLVQHGLLDELRLWIHPVLRGEGEQLFASGVSGAFAGVETRAFASGAVVLVLTDPKS